MFPEQTDSYLLNDSTEFNKDRLNIPQKILESEAHGDRVDSIAWCNKGLRFISGSKDGSAILWYYERSEWSYMRLWASTQLDG